MGVCSVKDCTGQDHPHHSFPKTVALKRKWEEQIDRENFTVTENSKVCEKHFEKESFVPAHLNVNARGEKLKKKPPKATSLSNFIFESKEAEVVK